MINRSISFDRILLYLTCIGVLVLAAYTIRGELNRKDIAYIDIGKLAENYKLKKDLENVAAENLYRIREVIDSLKMIKKLSGTANSKVDTQLSNAEYAFKQYYTQSNQEISKKMWERLNPAIEDYGKERKLELLIGANGAGSLLYADKKRDLTDDLVAYVNRKYEQGN